MQSNEATCSEGKVMYGGVRVWWGGGKEEKLGLSAAELSVRLHVHHSESMFTQPSLGFDGHLQ